MTMREFLNASLADPLIAVYVLAALFALGVIAWEFSSYFWQRWRSRRKARNVIQFRRGPQKQSLRSLVVLNVRDRIDESRERYKHWRHGDRLVGDELIERMKGLR